MTNKLLQEILPGQAKADAIEGANPDPEIPAKGPKEKPKPDPVRDVREAPSEVPPVGEHVPEHQPDRARL